MKLHKAFAKGEDSDVRRNMAVITGGSPPSMEPPRRHTAGGKEEIRQAFRTAGARYGRDGVYAELLNTRGFCGMYYAGARMGLGWGKKRKSPSRAARRYPEGAVPGEKVPVDVEEVPYCCLEGAAKRDGTHRYQWTAIGERTRLR